MAFLRIAPVVAALVLASCGQGEAPEPRDESGGAGGSQETAYQGALTVIETPEHGPQLTAMVAQSYPPQGGGMDVANWDWDAVEHEEASGTSWGHYIVTGTFDGEAFSLTEDPLPSEEVDMADYPHLDHAEPDFPEPSEELGAEELQGIVDDLAERFGSVVVGGWVDGENAVARVDTYLITDEVESYVAETYPEGTVVLTSMLKPIS